MSDAATTETTAPTAPATPSLWPRWRFRTTSVAPGPFKAVIVAAFLGVLLLVPQTFGAHRPSTASARSSASPWRRWA